MTAMRLLHRELVEKPSEEDKKFKPRKSNPNQWKILQGPCSEYGSRIRDNGKVPDRLEETYVSTMEDARMAATALQNLIHNWNEDLI